MMGRSIESVLIEHVLELLTMHGTGKEIHMVALEAVFPPYAHFGMVSVQHADPAARARSLSIH